MANYIKTANSYLQCGQSKQTFNEVAYTQKSNPNIDTTAIMYNIYRYAWYTVLIAKNKRTKLNLHATSFGRQPNWLHLISIDIQLDCFTIYHPIVIMVFYTRDLQSILLCRVQVDLVAETEPTFLSLSFLFCHFAFVQYLSRCFCERFGFVYKCSSFMRKFKFYRFECFVGYRKL